MRCIRRNKKTIEGYNQQGEYEYAYILKENCEFEIATLENESDQIQALLTKAEEAITLANEELSRAYKVYEVAQLAYDAMVISQNENILFALEKVEQKTIEIQAAQRTREKLQQQISGLKNDIESNKNLIKTYKQQITDAKNNADEAKEKYTSGVFANKAEKEEARKLKEALRSEYEKIKKKNEILIENTTKQINKQQSTLHTLTPQINIEDNHIEALYEELTVLENTYMQIESDAQSKIDVAGEALVKADETYSKAEESLATIHTELERAYVLDANTNDSLDVAYENFTNAVEAWELASDALVTISNELDIITENAEVNVQNAQVLLLEVQLSHHRAQKYYEGVIAGGKHAALRNEKEIADEDENYYEGYVAGYDAIMILEESKPVEVVDTVDEVDEEVDTKQEIKQLPSIAIQQQATGQPTTGDKTHVVVMICMLGVSCLILTYTGRKVYKRK